MSKPLRDRFEAAKARSEGPPQEQARRKAAIHLEATRRRNLENQNKALMEELHSLEERQRKMLGLKVGFEKLTWNLLPVKAKTGRGEAVAMGSASDWHSEEIVEPASVNGLNDFNLAVCKKRSIKFFDGFLSITDMCRTRSVIDTALLWLGGDFITGYIHEELEESNALSPTMAIIKVAQLLMDGISLLRQNFKKLNIICNYGNHGRTTKKKRIKTGAQNSYEFMMYHFLKMRFEERGKKPGDGEIEWNIAPGYFAFQEVYGRMLRLHHGDGIQYQGGIGGVHIPLNKAIGQWNKANKADIDVLGHWHTRMTSPNYSLNSSLIGYSDFSIVCKASYEPPTQNFTLLHPVHGKTVESPITLL